MTTYLAVRTPVAHHKDAGRYDAHIAEIVGPAVWVEINVPRDVGQVDAYRFRVIIRTNGRHWVNVTLARTGQSITTIGTADFRNAGLAPWLRSSPKRLAQAVVNRICYHYGKANVAEALHQAENAGPVANPELPAGRIDRWSA